MAYDVDLVAHKLNRWRERAEKFNLPRWEEIPNLDLYMDQVIVLLSRYLDILPNDGASGKVITAATVNNYVRMKIMPPPQKKKYGRIHMAYLLMICILKQSVNISNIQRMIPLELTPQEMRDRYTDFVEKNRLIADTFIEQVASSATEILDCGAQAETAIDTMAVSAALAAGYAKLLSEKLLSLQDVDAAAVLQAERDFSVPEEV